MEVQELPTSRGRDKDEVPSKFVYKKGVDGTYDRVPRPRTLTMGMFYAFEDIPAKQVRLLSLMLGNPTCPITEVFLRDTLVPRLRRVHDVSLRLLDWLVVDYACAHNVAYVRYLTVLFGAMVVE